MSDQAKEIERLDRLHGGHFGIGRTAPGCTTCATLALARRLLVEAQGAEHNEGLMRTDLIAAEERIASLEREVASYEGMSAAVDHYQEEVRRLERELDETRKRHSHYVDGVCDVCRQP